MGRDHERKRNKHSSLCSLLADRLKEKPYVKHILHECEYPLGECDVLTEQGNGVVYYEIKCNDTPRGREKARKQLLRWSQFVYRKYGVNAHGVYWTPTHMEYMVKNGGNRK